MKAKKKNIVILASGSGSNADRLMAHFADSPLARVAGLISDREGIGALEVAARHGVDHLVVPMAEQRTGSLSAALADLAPDLIVLAGYLRLIPAEVVTAYPRQMINLHPSLLPAHGGKGMWGHHVHESVLASGERQSGITIHYVSERFDEGAKIAQFYCPVLADDSVADLAGRINRLEHRYLPLVAETLLL